MHVCAPHAERVIPPPPRFRPRHAAFREPPARGASLCPSAGVSCVRDAGISPADSPAFAPGSGSWPYFLAIVGCGTSASRKHTTTRPRMAHVTCPECGAPAKASRAATPQSVPAQRRKTHPVTWVTTAAIIPLLCWDAWQTYEQARLPKTSVDVKLGPVPRDWGYMPRLEEQPPTPVVQEHGRMPDSVALRSDPSLPQQIR